MSFEVFLKISDLWQQIVFLFALEVDLWNQWFRDVVFGEYFEISHLLWEVRQLCIILSVLVV
jgi:hypothetical protein